MDEVRQLVQQAQAGNRDAYDALVLRFQDMAVGYAYTLLSDFQLAEDAAQEAFLGAYLELSMLRRPAAFPGWLRQLVFTRCSRLRRSDHSRFQVVPISAVRDLPIDHPNPLEEVAQQEMQALVLQAMRKLPESQYQALVLYYFSQRTQQEIAAFLDVPLSTVEKRLQYARQRLKERLRFMAPDHLNIQHPSKDQQLVNNVLDGLNLRPFGEEDHKEISRLMLDGIGPLPPNVTYPYAHSTDYMANLRNSDPDGCFLALLDGRPIGYISTHRNGVIGHLGQHVIEADQRGKGYGRTLLQAAVDYLASRCEVIGVVVYSMDGVHNNTHDGDRIGLYHKIGFRETFPARQVAKDLDIENLPARPDHIKFGAEIDPVQIPAITSAVDAWSQAIYPGLELGTDLAFFMKRYPNHIALYFEGDQPRGFMALHDDFLAEVWGAVAPGEDDENIFDALLQGIEPMIMRDDQLIMARDKGICIRYHTHNRRLTELFLRNGYRILDENSCMILHTHQGRWTEQMADKLYIRPW